MKRLIAKSLAIISPKHEEAKIIQFKDGLNIITGDISDGKAVNRTGKSLIMKSLYYALGAKLSKYTANWSNLQLSTIIEFTYDGNTYKLFRNRDKFVLDKDSEISVFTTINDLRNFYVILFDCKLKLPANDQATKTMYAYPGAMFMPFYIDQDVGWSGKWDSFSDITSGKWKPEIIQYHLGVKTSRYYELIEEKICFEKDRTALKKKHDVLEELTRNHIERYKDYLDVTINLEDYIEDLASLTKEMNSQIEIKNTLRNALMDNFNSMRELDELYVLAKKTYEELLNDADYVETYMSDEMLLCPVCGTSHNNDAQNKFSLYSEIEQCEASIQDYYSKRAGLEEKSQSLVEEIEKLDIYITNINSILDRKRDEITLNDVIKSEGSRSVLVDMRNEILEMHSKIAQLSFTLKKITKELTAITKDGADITKAYLNKLQMNISKLDVADIDDAQLSKFTASFKSGGNDLPCAILAQVYAIYSVASVYSKTVLPPLVLDAIFQQEPARRKLKVIWDFVNKIPENAQVIVSTTEMHGFDTDANIIMCKDERRLLNNVDYRVMAVEYNTYFKYCDS